MTTEEARTLVALMDRINDDNGLLGVVGLEIVQVQIMRRNENGDMEGFGWLSNLDDELVFEVSG